MSQNFSEMSNIYIPELIELDLYWQKAVEDAIRDTLNDEQKLHCALRNRKIINQKLENLGLGHVHSRMFLSELSHSESESAEDDQESLDLKSVRSRSSSGGESKEIDPVDSRSGSDDKRDPLFTDRHKNPDRPLLGNGSLEKMKKSQNSFNCEPMGMDDLNEDLAESEKEEENVDYDAKSEHLREEDEDKKIHWLHVRDDSDFEGSGAESVQTGLVDDYCEENELGTVASYSTESNFVNQNFGLRSSHRRRKISKSQQNVSLGKNLFWENRMNSMRKKRVNSKRKFRGALMKEDIFKHNVRGPFTERNVPMETNMCARKIIARRKKVKKYVTPFIKFYLEMYKELGHKYPKSQITEETAKRWRVMSKAQKAKYSDLRDTH